MLHVPPGCCLRRNAARLIAWSFLAGLVWPSLPGVIADEGARVSATTLFAQAAELEERRWQRQFAPEPPDERTTARGLIACALTLAEAGVHAERIPRLLELLERMQDTDEDSPGYGNFWWYWRDGAVTDRNSVEFVMQTATRLWVRHASNLDPAVATTLRRMMALGAEGCLRHRVPAWYTNIARLDGRPIPDGAVR
jgi:hypothetical protein